MLYRRRLDMEMEELKPDLSILFTASEELKASKRFQTLLRTVLAMGNTLNGGTFRGGAAGFSLDSLLKVRWARRYRLDKARSLTPLDAQLQDVRAANASAGTPTLLHYLVRIVRRQDPALLAFLEELPHLEAASRSESLLFRRTVRLLTRTDARSHAVSSTTVQETVQSLVAGVAQAEQELDALRTLSALSPQDRFIPVMEVRALRLSSILSSWRALTSLAQQFVRHASPAMSALASHGKVVSEQLRDLLLFFGEDPAQVKPEELFDLVAQFAALLRVRRAFSVDAAGRSRR